MNRLIENAVRVLSIVCAGFVLLPTTARASATATWNSSGDGAWEDASKWTGGAPSNDTTMVNIVNAGGKTVTISAATPAANLTTVATSLNIEGGLGLTNTLLIKGNTTPLVLPSLHQQWGTGIGMSSGKVGAVVMDGGWMVNTNAAKTGGQQIGGYSQPYAVGFMTVSNNSTWLADCAMLGYGSASKGSLDLAGGTYTFKGANFFVGQSGGTGTIAMTDGHLVTTNASIALGRDGGFGSFTKSGGLWEGLAVEVGKRNASAGTGALTLSGGTNVFVGAGIVVGSGVGSVGALRITDGLIVSTNATTDGGLVINGGSATIAGGRWIGESIIIASTVPGGALLKVTGGTNTFNHGFASHYFRIGNGATTYGDVLITGGLLVTTNGIFGMGAQGGVGTVTVSNGTWVVDGLAVGQNTPNNRVTIAGGEVLANPGVSVGYQSSGVRTNNALLMTGGLLEANIMNIYAGATNNVISNSGGVYQFTTITPSITTNDSGAIILNGGTIAFRGVTNVDVRLNQTGGANSLASMAFAGTNVFRLNHATNATSPDQSYTFAPGLGATNYARLELLNGSLWRGGNATIGAGGSLLVSNGISTVSGSLAFNATASLAVDASSAGNFGVLVATNVSLNGCALNLHLGNTPVLNTPMMIVSNTPTGTISGQFSNGTRWITTIGATDYVVSLNVASGSGVTLTTRLRTSGTCLIVE